jgi:hypothetical protein
VHTTVTTPRLHRRQFLIGPRPILVHDDWRVARLGRGLVLSHDPALPVHREGARALIGVAVRTDPERPEPAVELTVGSCGEETLSAWTGRWLLVDDGRVRLDATGTLACFHRQVDGATWASSSPELLRTLEPVIPRAGRRIVRGRGMEWFPPPGSGLEGIGCLLPSQTLRLADGGVDRRPLVSGAPARPYDGLLDRLERRLLTAVAGLGAGDGDIWVPLTGGRDSRLVLAAALAAGLAVRTYTFHLRVDAADRELPPKLARAAGIEHRIVLPGPVDAGRLDLWDRHTAGHAVDADGGFFAAGQLDHLAGCGVELGGNVFEVGRGYYDAALPAELPGTPRATAALIEREFPSARPAAVLAWATWLHETLHETLDWRERFYIEQRLAGWLGAIGQGTDLACVPRVHVANCTAYLAETLAIEPALRRAGRHQDDLTARLAPVLAELPVNPPGPLQERLRARARRELEEYLAQPTPVRYVSHRVRRWRGKRAAGHA